MTSCGIPSEVQIVATALLPYDYRSDLYSFLLFKLRGFFGHVIATFTRTIKIGANEQIRLSYFNHSPRSQSALLFSSFFFSFSLSLSRKNLFISMVVELQRHSIPSLLDESALDFSIEDSTTNPSVLRYFHLQACHPTLGIIACLNGVIINRSTCRGSFLRTMHSESRDLLEFSSKLFDRYGCLRPELLDDDYHKGSGCWGSEVNGGMMLYVTSVEVKPVVSTVRRTSMLFTKDVSRSSVVWV